MQVRMKVLAEIQMTCAEAPERDESSHAGGGVVSMAAIVCLLIIDEVRCSHHLSAWLCCLSLGTCMRHG